MTELFDRRSFLETTAGGAAALLFGASLRADDKEESKEKTAKHRLKISCSSLAFSDMGWEEALELMKKQGFRNAELAMFEGWTHVFPSRLEDPEAHGRKVAAVCERLDMRAVCIHANFAPGVDRGRFPGITTPDEKLRRKTVEHCDRVIRCAMAAGIPLVNVQPGRLVDGLSKKQCIANAVATLREMHAAAKKRGVRLSFENHTNSLGEQPEDALALLEAVPGLELDYDLSHVAANSISVEQSKPLLDRVGHVAVRNARAGNFALPVEKDGLAFELEPYLEALREAKVEGYIAVEYFRPDQRDDNVRLKRVLEKAGLSS